MVAIAVLPLSHVPPAGQLNNVVVAGHAWRVPVMEEGSVLMLISLETKQPPPIV